MMDGPHMCGFSPAALFINLTSALASVRRVWSVMAFRNAVTLNLVGLVLFLFSAIRAAFRLFPMLTQTLDEDHGQTRGRWRITAFAPPRNILRPLPPKQRLPSPIPSPR